LKGHHGESFLNPDKADLRLIKQFVGRVNGENKSYTGVIILCSVVGGLSIITAIVLFICYKK